MAVFEYLGVLISVIMGLGITHLATGASKLILNRGTVRLYVPHLLWTLNVLVYILLVWWGMFWWSNHTDWLAYEYLFITAYAIALFLLAALLYPWDLGRDVDMRAYFFRNRRWFFGTLFVAWLIDFPETVLKSETGLRGLPEEYHLFLSLHLIIAATGFVASNRIVHTVLPVLWLTLMLYYAMGSLVVGTISV